MGGDPTSAQRPNPVGEEEKNDGGAREEGVGIQGDRD